MGCTGPEPVMLAGRWWGSGTGHEGISVISIEICSESSQHGAGRGTDTYVNRARGSVPGHVDGEREDALAVGIGPENGEAEIKRQRDGAELSHEDSKAKPD